MLGVQGGEAFQQLGAQGGRMGPGLLALCHGVLHGSCHGAGPHHVGGATAQPAFLPAAKEQRLHAGAAAQVHKARALERTQLVGREGRCVDAAFLQVHLDLAQGLHAVCEEERAQLVGRICKLAHGLDGAQLVVHGHHAHQRKLPATGQGLGGGLLQRLRRDDAAAVGGHAVDLEAQALEARRGVCHGMVLDGAHDDVCLLRLGVGGQQAAHGHVVSLRAAAGEDYLGGLAGSHRTGDAAARILELAARLAPFGIEGVGVCPAAACEHLVEARVEGCGGRVVEVDPPLLAGTHALAHG